MIRTYHLDGKSMRVCEGEEALEDAASAVWIDLLEPTAAEEKAVEAVIDADIPTLEEMVEIEASSRLYQQDSAAVMTAPLLLKSRVDYPTTTAVTFVLTPRFLVTVRYAEPTPFQTFAGYARRSPSLLDSPEQTLAALLDAIVDRIADVLEQTALELDDISRTIFKAGTRRATSADAYDEQMQNLGRNGDIVSKVTESLIGLSRLMAYARALPQIKSHRRAGEALRTASRDVRVLQEHAMALSGKVTFLLDAMLGMINIEQNRIVKTFSIVAVIFLPPTLIASVYGMNFAHIPELGSRFGYPLALLAMVVSMIAPFWYFRRKNWV